MATRSKRIECSVCKAEFKVKSELTDHLINISPSCKTIPKKRESDRNSPAITSSHRREPTRERENSICTLGSRLTSEAALTDATLVAAMEAEMKFKEKSVKSGLETAMLSMIADGDDELVSAYKRIAVDSDSGKRRINKEVVGFVTRKSKLNIDRAAAIISRAQNVSICFLLDTTGSMSSYISGVKEQIVEIVTIVEGSGCEIKGLAFVGYKDWCDGIDHFEILPFTKSIQNFKTFVASIRAKGGGDFPEDVIGGLNKAVSLSWPQQCGTRIIFHLGDAPPHGKTLFHNHRDSYENGHPKDRPLKDLFEEMHRKELMYYFGRINHECDKMINIFENYYGQRIDKLDSTQVSSICRSVTETVARSISVTYRAGIRAPVGIAKIELDTLTLEEKEPDWSKLPRLDGTIVSYGLPKSISEIVSFSKLEDKIKKCRLQIAPTPFARGSIRLAYYGKVCFLPKDETSSASAQVIDDVVFKKIISPPKIQELDRQRYLSDLEVQTIAAKLAFEFNDKLSKTALSIENDIKIKFLMTKVVRFFEQDCDSPRFFAYEKRFYGTNSTLIKYTNNIDFVLDSKTLDENGRRRLELAVAFSHFTHSVTDGYLLVCDLQGISHVDEKGKETLLLTDPAAHCSKHLRFGKTNLSTIGIKKFFEKHVCNKYCDVLELRMP